MKHSISIIVLAAFPDKKIKSLGNKSLLKVSKNTTLLEHQISALCEIYKKPQIIVVGGFEGKRLNKLISSSSHTKGVEYIEHAMLPTFNIGKSVNDGIKIATSNNILIYNSSLVLKRKAFSKILNNKKQSYVLCTKDTKGDIGCIDDNNSLINCFFDIGHKVYDFLYLSEKDGLVLKNMCKSGMVKDNLYLFEIINLCIGQNMSISTLDVNEKEVKIIDSMDSITSLQKNIRSYV
jgi:bifunctional N-acetylglucosamine-1-phosphate-uridyltransferase/glucosamine-1-phosphate-acetyltransferase GlmU-like protein